VTNAPPAQRDVTFVFQQYSLYPHLSVYDNLAFPLRSPIRRIPEDEIKRTVEKVASLLRIIPKLGNRATHLSGGEMQRVAIARALVSDPEAILCDEPTGNLDSVTSQDILSLLRGLPAAGRCSVVMVTHDAEAASFGDRVIHIRDGLVERDEESLPAAPRVATRGLS
jgi:multiple sugar transport system ATP-binding protein